MIHLLIDGTPVYLSIDQIYDYYARNPIFTKEGEHTYDLEINLNVPSNAIMYNHINRRDCNRVPTGRSATLYDNNICIIRGTEIVLSVEKNIAKIQLVSGNSELNFLSGGKIRKMDFGTIDLTLQKARESLSGSYPDFNYVCCPVLANTDNNFFGDGSVYYNQVDTQSNSQSPVTMSGATLRAQPYLLYYIEKIVELLGYKLNNNVLRNDKMKNLICINGLDTNYYAELLPDWTAEEFISHIEKQFNVLFVVNQNSKSVDIMRTNVYYENKTTIDIPAEDLLMNYEKEFEQDKDLYTNYINVRYKFPTGMEYYQFADIDPDILKLCEFRENRLWDFDISPDTFNKMIIYKEKFFGNKHVFRKDDSAGHMEFYQHLMYFQRVVNDETEDNFVELEIIPAEIYIRQNGFPLNFTVPLARNVLEVSDSTQNKQGLIDYIVDGIQEKQAPNHLFIAFYAGYQEYFISVNSSTGESVRSSSSQRIPMCQTTPFHHGAFKFGDSSIYAVFPDKTITLQLDGENGLYNSLYKFNQIVNTRNKFKISFLRRGKLYDPMAIYNLANQKFFCEELKYSFDSNGLNEVVEGTFFPM